MKNKRCLNFSLGLISLFAMFLLCGCELGMTNLTPQKVPQNPSGIYALELEVSPKNANIDPSSIDPYIVIDGQTHKMTPADKGSHTYRYDHKMPFDANHAKYYYLVNYTVRNRDRGMERQIQSSIYEFELTNRYVSTFSSERGVAGAQIAVMGQGFMPNDTILVGDVAAETKYVNPFQLIFTVPPVKGDMIYDLELANGTISKPIGEFRVDASQLHVNKSRLDLKTGQRALLILQTNEAAPKDGLEIVATTDIPESIIMPPLHMSEHSQTVSVTVEGGEPGSGTLYLQADGYSKIALPVTVSEDEQLHPLVDEILEA